MVALLGIIHCPSWIWHHSSDWLKRTREYPDPDPVLATVLLLKDLFSPDVQNFHSSAGCTYGSY